GLVRRQYGAGRGIEQGRVDAALAIALAVGDVGENIVIHLPVKTEVPGVGVLAGVHHAALGLAGAGAEGWFWIDVDVGVAAPGIGAHFLLGLVVAVADVELHAVEHLITDLAEGGLVGFFGVGGNPGRHGGSEIGRASCRGR